MEGTTVTDALTMTVLEVKAPTTMVLEVVLVQTPTMMVLEDRH